MKKTLLYLLLISSINFISGQTILGVDVSHHQGDINWTQVYNDNKVFAFVKSTEGMTYTDPQFVTNMQNGTAAGVVMGAYHFARPDNNSATDDANNFVNIASSYVGDGYLPPVLDLEDPGNGTSLTSIYTSTQLTAWVQQWIDVVVAATGVQPIIYTSTNYAEYLNSSLNVYGLWIAKPGTSPTDPPSNIGVWEDWAFKQYSWVGSVSGIVGDVDLNVFNGTIDDFNALINPEDTAPILSYSSHIIDDDMEHSSIGDSDGKAEPSEDIELRIEIYNSGNATANNITGILSTTDPDIDITDDSQSWAPVNESAYEWTSDFDFLITSDCPEKDVTFTLELTSSEGSWTDTFVIHIYPDTPTLSYADYQIDDDMNGLSSGDGDSYVEAGESIELPVQLANLGSHTAHNVLGVLSTTDPDISITEDTLSWGDIAVDTDSWVYDFDFTVSSECQDKDVIFTLELSSDEGSWTENFTIHVHRVLAIDDMALQQSLKVFPNPTTGIINYQSDDYIIDLISVYDLNNRLIHTINSQVNSSIDLSELATGLYLIRFKDDKDRSASFRIIKK